MEKNGYGAVHTVSNLFVYGTRNGKDHNVVASTASLSIIRLWLWGCVACHELFSLQNSIDQFYFPISFPGYYWSHTLTHTGSSFDVVHIYTMFIVLFFRSDSSNILHSHQYQWRETIGGSWQVVDASLFII
jgi:hypothetical protein